MGTLALPLCGSERGVMEGLRVPLSIYSSCSYQTAGRKITALGDKGEGRNGRKGADTELWTV